MTPITPLESRGEMFQRAKTPSLLLGKDIPRPASQVTENAYTDFEDEDSEFEEDSLRGSTESFDSRRRSETTISSYDELPTPKSESTRPFEIRLKPVQGPNGPHLFRASQHSADFTFDCALQLSPVAVKEEPARTETAFSQKTVVQQQWQAQQAGNLARYIAQIPGLPDNVEEWTSDDVVDWMHNIGVEMSIIDDFRTNDINGQVLVEMESEDLKELGIQSFGKRHQIWNAISNLKGGEMGFSPLPTPFQDISRPCTNIRSKSDGDIPLSACVDTPVDDEMTPISLSGPKKKRTRKHRHHNEPKIEPQPETRNDDGIKPSHSVSIVAIEQLMPKPHNCSKGENCPKWRKQQRLIARLKNESGWPVSPGLDGRIMITGDPGNAMTAANILPNVRRQDEPARPESEVVPSVVASSDILGPGQLPEFALHEDMLQRIGQRDPQENVKQFLGLQHVNIASSSEEPKTPPLELFPEKHFPGLSTLPQQIQPPLQPPRHTAAPHENLRQLPKLAIPRAATASPSLARHGCRQIGSPITALSPCRSATASPSTVYRLATPASEIDVPVTRIPSGPIARDTSQSVPPNMQYRDPISVPRSLSRAADHRRPSFGMPPLNEGEVFSPATRRDPQTGLQSPCTGPRDPPLLSASQAHYGIDTTHAGWMKKRKTKLLRQEWNDAHFRLTGTQLAMHATNRHSSPALDTINVDDYSVACSTVASNNKLTAALKSLKISNEKKTDATAFAFQLVPSSAHASAADHRERAKLTAGAGKTHHFAVKTKDERIDWMRELMLAKALRQKEAGFQVEINGSKV